jgi:hypothetical protein
VSNLATTGYDTFGSDRDAPSGRHALSEDAVLTPIFHALTRGGLRATRRPDSARPANPLDPIEQFRRDPLTAPIPLQALMAVPSQPWRRQPTEPSQHATGRRSRRGRHHRRLELVSY